jgi:hypothetical protein
LNFGDLLVQRFNDIADSLGVLGHGLHDVRNTIVGRVRQEAGKQHSSKNDNSGGSGTRDMPTLQIGHQWINEDCEKGSEQQRNSEGTCEETKSHEKNGHDAP